jgi:ATP-dependent Lhr-like helicase
MRSDDALNMLHPLIRELVVKRGFRELTEPQVRAIPVILSGKNTLLMAPTGSGKTEAALLPVLSMYLNLPQDKPRGVYILYITPLRALNRDLLRRIEWWASNAGLNVAVRHGDTDKNERARQSRNPPELLITTPETLQILFIGSRLREHISKVKWVIVDEVHELVEDKRGSQLAIGLQKLKMLAGRFQVIGLSASVGSPSEVAKFLVGNDEDCEIINLSFVRDYKFDVINPAVTLSGGEIEELKGRYVKAEGINVDELFHRDALARLLYIMNLIDNEGKSSIVFVNTRSMAELLTSRILMVNPTYPVSIHHSSLSRVSRLNTEEMLRGGRLKAVVATSSLELGIDIGHVDQVIQYVSPHQVTRLVQRVGRSGHRLDKVPRGVVVTEDINDTLEAIAIVNRARAGWLEPTKTPEKPYDVLFNQIASLVLMRPRWTVDEIMNIVKGSYPYRNLSRDELVAVLRFMSEGIRPRLVYFIEDEGVVLKPRNPRSRAELRMYFFNNLSMIPEEKQYLVTRIDTNEAVGVLDEAFMAEYGEPGVKFVFRGNVWVLRSIKDDVVYVEPAKDPVGAIPSWIGEEIPVPFEIAQDVGRIKRVIADELIVGKGYEAVVDELTEKLGVSRRTIEYVVSAVREQLRHGFVPTDDVVVIERVGELVVVHASFGTLVNRTLSRLLASYMTNELGLPVRVQQDPYAIILQLPSNVNTSIIIDALNSLARLSMDELLQYIRRIALETGLFKRKVIHIARRFNVIKGDKSLSDISITNLIQALEGTPVYVEALREFITSDLDVDRAVAVLRAISQGSIKVQVFERSEFSPMAREILSKASSRLEVIAPERLDKLIMESVKARLMNESLTMACLNCGNVYVGKVKELIKDLRCPRCGSVKLAASKMEPDKVAMLLRRSDGDDYERLVKAGELITKYGWRGLLAVASRVSLRRAEELLSSDGSTEELGDLVARLYNAEREEMRQRFFS